jgi:predicted phosphodiesterase
MKKTCLLFCLILPLFLFNAKGQEVKIIVASDLHYFDPSLLIHDGSAFQNYLLTERKLIKESDAITKSLIKAIKNEGPDIVLLPGDLTKDGEKASHKRLAQMLDSLQLNGKTKVFVVPGNHDVKNGIACAYDNDKTIPVENISREDFRKIYSKFGYGDAIYIDTASLSYVAEPIKGLWILGMDACQYDLNKPGHFPITGGNFKPQTYNWIIGILKKARFEHKSVLAFMHHGIMQHFISEGSDFPEYFVKGYDTISTKMMELGLKVVFTGHFHAQDIARKNGENNNFLYNIETGSTVTFPCPYRIVILKDSIMDVRTKHITSVNCNTQGKSFSEYANLALTKVLTNSTKNKLMASPYSLQLTQADILTPHFVKAMLAHYAGDEKIPATEDTFIDSLTGLKDLNLIKLGFSLKYLWTDLFPADNNVVLNLKTGAVMDFLY